MRWSEKGRQVAVNANMTDPRRECGLSVRMPGLVVAGAVALVFLAPVAGAGMIGSSGGAGAVGHVTGHRVVKHKNPIGHKTSKPAKTVVTVVTVGKLKPVPAKPPTVPAPTVPVAPPPVPYISLPGAVTSLTSSTDSSACVDTGTLCTAEQLCEIWGMNCPSVPPVEPGPASASEASTGADPAVGG